jgi:NADPH2:quinone reductase
VMKAVWYDKNGAADDVLVAGEVETPTPGPGEVLVRLHASGVNPSDVKARAGARPMGFPRIIPHSDGAGIVEAVGDRVDKGLVGQRVFVRNGQWGRAAGTAAEYIAIDADYVHHLPQNIGFDCGAALGIPALTAAHAVLKDGNVEGSTILIHGGGGTVGRLAVQIATKSGAKVITTTGRDDQIDELYALGAAAVFDYRDPDLAAQILSSNNGHPVQRVIDGEIGMNLGSSIEVVETKGHIVGYGSALHPNPELPFLGLMFKNITLSGILVYLLESDEAQKYAEIITRLLHNGDLNVPIANRFDLSEAALAHQAVEAGQRHGAVVLQIA